MERLTKALAKIGAAMRDAKTMESFT